MLFWVFRMVSFFWTSFLSLYSSWLTGTRQVRLSRIRMGRISRWFPFSADSSLLFCWVPSVASLSSSSVLISSELSEANSSFSGLTFGACFVPRNSTLSSASSESSDSSISSPAYFAFCNDEGLVGFFSLLLLALAVASFPPKASDREESRVLFIDTDMLSMLLSSSLMSGSSSCFVSSIIGTIFNTTNAG